MLFARSSIQALLLLGLFCAVPLLSSAAEIRNVNFAVFQTDDDDFEFESIVLGKFSDFIEAMEGSQILLLSHSTNSVDGDVINLQQDVLRESEGELNDIGINCSLNFRDMSTDDSTAFELGGMCKILDSLNTNVTAIIPMSSLPDTEQGINAWVKLHENKENGIAFYANVSSDE